MNLFDPQVWNNQVLYQGTVSDGNKTGYQVPGGGPALAVEVAVDPTSTGSTTLTLQSSYDGATNWTTLTTPDGDNQIAIAAADAGKVLNNIFYQVLGQYLRAVFASTGGTCKVAVIAKNPKTASSGSSGAQTTVSLAD